MATRFGSRQDAELVLRAAITEKITVRVVFTPFHFVKAAANLLTNDVLDPQARIPKFKSCAMQATLLAQWEEG